MLFVFQLIQHISFENMPFFRESINIFRIPSINSLLQHHELMNKDDIKLENAYYVVDPDNTLQESQDYLVPYFNSLEWDGACGRLPIFDELKKELETRDLFVYAGHGSGSQCFSKEGLYRLKIKAMSILMGCSSVQLTTEGEFDANGRTVLNYLSSGW